MTIRPRPSQTRISALALSLLTLCWISAWAFETSLPPAHSTESLLDHVRYLSSDELMGRGVDTPGIKLARDYIAREFAQYGLLPGGDNGSYFQGFETTIGVTVKQPTTLALNGLPALSLENDWNPLGLSASGHSEAGVVFVGYGITVKDYGYDDYAGVDAKGKIVIALRYEPPPKDAKSPFRGAPRYSTYATLRAKVINARDHGAAGLVLVDLETPRQGTRELISTKSSFARMNNGILAAQVRRAVLDKWLADQHVSLSDLKEKIDREEKPASVELPNLKISLAITLEPLRERVENVIGILPGSDPKLKNESIVIGAHYDHLGFGHFGSLNPSAEGQIHHGADDNASGTSVLLGVAEEMARTSPKPRRTILFTAFSGEELGLLGSRYYVEHPAMPLTSTTAMLNMDMVGRLRDNKLTVFGARSGSDLSAMVRDQARRLGFEVTESDSVGRSDHMSFYNKKIPSVHFFTGSHSDYHRPSDTWDKINEQGMNKVRDLVFSVAQQLANDQNPLTFVSLPSRPPNERGEETSRGYGAYLGTIPDFADNVEGVRLAGVTEGSPAAVAGLKEGDVIVQFAGNKITSLEDLAMMLGTKHPGDRVEIIVLRKSRPLTFTALLRNRG